MLDSYNRLACLLNSIQYFNPRTTFNVVKYKKAQNFIREGYILLTLVSNNNEQTSAYQFPQYIYNSYFRNREGCTFLSEPPPLLPLLLLVSYLETSFTRFSEMYYLLAKLNEKKLIYLECSTNHNVSYCFNFVFCFNKLHFIFKEEISLIKFRISDICVSLGRCDLFNDPAKFMIS